MKARGQSWLAGPGLALSLALSLAMLGGVVPAPAFASPSLASDLGCYNCHGSPPRGKSPSFPQLAARYSAQRGDDAALARSVEHLRAGSMLGAIEAHRRLSADDAARLVRWISEGAH